MVNHRTFRVWRAVRRRDHFDSVGRIRPDTRGCI